MNHWVKKLSDLWIIWGVRVLILASLSLQIILTIFGHRRKSTSKRVARALILAAYLTAEWVATAVLDEFACTTTTQVNSSEGTNVHLQELWAPFLLLHLGGPDAITSFTLEDNELWLTLFFEFVIQVKVVFYVFIQYWSSNAITLTTIPIAVSGIIKCGERIWARKSSSTKYFKNSLPSEPESYQDLVRYEEQDWGDNRLAGAKVVLQDYIQDKDRDLAQAFYLFQRFKYFFVGQTLSKKERIRIYSIIKDKCSVEAFNLVEIELGFMYDLLYTKANIVYSKLGIFLRFVSFFCSVSALVAFAILVDVYVYPAVDISITSLLLVVSVVLEIYAIVLLLLSDWTNVWLMRVLRTLHNPIVKRLVYPFWRHAIRYHSLATHTKRWSQSMGQFNLIDSCLRNVPSSFTGIQKSPNWKDLLKEKTHLGSGFQKVDELQEMIFRYVQEQGKKVNGSNQSYIRRNVVLDLQRGILELDHEARSDFEEKINWSTNCIYFIDSLVIWHIATDILYHADLDHGHVGQLKLKTKISKYLSEYMMYLLVFHSSMLPKDVGKRRYKEARDEAIKLIKRRKLDKLDKRKVPMAMYRHYLGSLDEDNLNGMLMEENQSLLKYGCLLAKKLQMLMERHGQEVTWEVISEIWVDILAYAAHNCEWKEHARHLCKGGELLTHVCLLMAHFGLSKQYVDNECIPFMSQHFQEEEVPIDLTEGETIIEIEG